MLAYRHVALFQSSGSPAGNAMTSPSDAASGLTELRKEQTFRGMGATKARAIPRIDMSAFAARKAEIAEQLWTASTDIGFFQLVNHGIGQEQIDEAFTMAERFFALSHETKSRYPLVKGTNAGWEYKSQVRPSTGTPDQKESYQITLPRMAALWPTDDELPRFKAIMLAFERANWALGMKVLSCFADKLGFKPDFFTDCHDPRSSEYQSTLRLLHYLPMTDAKPADFTGWRAGAHTDFDCSTLLSPRSGQCGLQLCPGKEHAEFAWTDVEPLPGVVTCNIGDMLMRWSDDRLLSTLHRVRMPRADEYLGSRYSMPFFCQANKDAVIRGPGKIYPPITAHDYLQQRIAANYAT
jgi:isopenicillin N synthase-like dioxygenase